jgi:D-alanyl-lipoteichoic acid acyltransferase DltB (MBOAT superfamily)
VRDNVGSTDRSTAVVFNSFTFAVFLPVVLLVYYRLSHRLQNVWLLAAGIVFYGWWDWRFLGLLGATTVLDYIASHRIHAATTQGVRKRWLLASLTGNLTILGFFKYFNFFVDSTEALLGSFGVTVHPPTLRVILPIGVSFYTFQEIAYTIDVYRGHLKPCRRFLDFALFVCYFPQLVAGPIQRATDLLPQLEQPRRITGEQIRAGAQLIFLGLFKKVVVADALAPMADVHFGQPQAFSGASLLFGLYLFAVQIYGDFCGYSDVARGISKLLGVELALNFRQPYFATSITDFWRRWHISLSSWLRDYLYIPLGGNRGSSFATYRNLMLTMLLGGLWHGASWTFVVWGGLHGLYLAVHKAMGAGRERAGASSSGLVNVLKGLATFHLVCLTWIFFRADSFSGAWTYLTRIVTWADGDYFFGAFDTLQCVVLVACLAVIDLALEGKLVRWPSWSQAPWARGLAYGVALLVWLGLGGVDANVPFIYFQF